MKVSLKTLILLNFKSSLIWRFFIFLFRLIRTTHYLKYPQINIFKNKTVILVGSGQSSLNLNEIKDDELIVALNGSYKILLPKGIKPDYVIIEDYRAYQKFYSELLDLKIKTILASDLPKSGDSLMLKFMRNYGYPKFLEYPKWTEGNTYFYGTTCAYFALQLIYNYPPKKVSIYGIDMSYKKLINSIIVGSVEIIISNESYPINGYNDFEIRRYENPELIIKNMKKSLEIGFEKLNQKGIVIENNSFYNWDE